MQGWVSDHIAAAGLRLKPDAAAQLAGWLGEDVGRLDGILATLRSTFGSDHMVSASDLQPFLGEAGGVPPWDFTDAIDAGNTTKALTLLARMTNGGGRHPLQVMSILHNHYSGLAKLDGVDARTRAGCDGARRGSSRRIPAKKALQNYQRLGGAAVKRAIGTARRGRSRPARSTRTRRRRRDGRARRAAVETPPLKRSAGR